MRGTLVIGTVFAAALSSRAASAQECAGAPAEWLFCDDFESSADQDGNLGLWDDQGQHPANLVLDTAVVHSGARSLQITAHKGADTGGGPTKWFLPGVDQLYVRFWVRFAPDYNYTHHLVFLGANQASNQWSAFGTAGCRPSGSNFFVTNIEPFGEWGAHPPPGAWGYYTYSVDMTCDPGSSCANYADPQQICDDCATKGSPCNNGLECCWGANDVSSPPAITPLGQWACLEGRVQANTGSQANGSQTLFVDGNQVGEWSGIHFRDDDGLKWNALGLWHYVTDDVYAAGQTEQTLWFDDVVVSTAPIGCGTAPAGGGGAPGGGGGAPGGGGGAANGGSGNAANTGAASGTGGASSGGSSGSTAQGGANSAASSNDDGGCGCRAARKDRSSVWLALAGALAFVWRRRRVVRPSLRGLCAPRD